MAKNGLSTGMKLEPTAGAGGVASGDLVKVSDIHGVVTKDAANGEKYVLELMGEYTLPKITGGGTGGNLGAKAYAQDDGGTLKATASDGGGSNDLIGWFTEDAADGDAEAKVALSGQPV